MEPEVLYMYYDANYKKLYTPSFEFALFRARFYGTETVYEVR